MVRRGLSKDEDLQIDLPAHLGPASRSRAADDGDELEAVRVRWLRVNTLKWTTREAIAWLRADGFLEVSAIERLSASPRSFAYDAHLPMLLGLPPTFDLQACKPYLDGRFIAQDKASCFPAYILAAGTTSAISAIDACVSGALRLFLCDDRRTAAPGNKTTMLSALLSPAFGSVSIALRHTITYSIRSSPLSVIRSASRSWCGCSKAPRRAVRHARFTI